MKTLRQLLLVIPFFAVGLSAQAQEAFPVLPTEMFVCNFVGNSDMADFNDSFADFNAWADQHGISDLTSYALTPTFFSEDFEYDLIGLNIWGDGASFGSGNAQISSDANALSSFDGVVDCAAHSLYALVGIKPPTQEVAQGGVFEFSNCTLKGNRSNDEGIGALVAASQLFGQWNLNDAHAALFNIAGLPSDTSFQLKWVTYYPSIATFGALFDHMVNEGGVQALAAIMDPVMECDSSRMYNTSLMREAAE
jgi:hypothetical protein